MPPNWLFLLLLLCYLNEVHTMHTMNLAIHDLVLLLPLLVCLPPLFLLLSLMLC